MTALEQSNFMGQKGAERRLILVQCLLAYQVLYAVASEES